MRMSQLTKSLAELKILLATDYPICDGMIQIPEEEMDAIRNKLCECVQAMNQVGLGISLLQQTLNIL